MQTQELVTIVPWTFIAQICNLFIQIYLIKRFLFKPVSEILKKRKEAADAELSKAREAAEEAGAMKAEYEKDLSEAKAKAEEIISEAGRIAASRSESILGEAREEAASIRQSAHEAVELEKKKAVSEIRDEIGDMAVDIAGKVIERELTASDHEKFIEDFIRNAGGADE